MRQFWTDEQIVLLRSLYPYHRTEDVATMIGRPLRSVYNKAEALGLKKTAEYLASPAAGRTNGRQGITTRFAKGIQPWNKGQRFIAGGRAVETQFKAGQKPRTWQPIGTCRTTKDGTLQRKISDEPGNSSKRWRAVHELVWVQAHGPVPPKHIVVFKPGMRTAELEEITIDRVECITLAENMRRNTVHRLPKEIAELVQLRGALNRQINRRGEA